MCPIRLCLHSEAVSRTLLLSCTFWRTSSLVTLSMQLIFLHTGIQLTCAILVDVCYLCCGIILLFHNFNYKTLFNTEPSLFLQCVKKMSRWSNDLITGKLVLMSRLTNAFLCNNYIHIFTRKNMRNKRKHNRTVLGLYITTVRFPSHNNTAARCVRVHVAVAGHVILVARPRLVERPERTAVLDMTQCDSKVYNLSCMLVLRLLCTTVDNF